MGSLLKNNRNIRVLELRRQRKVYKRARTQGDSLCSSNARKRLSNTVIHIYSDNKTALKYVTKAGGTASFDLQDLAVKIQGLCNQHQLQVHYQHIPGVENIKADQLSRVRKPIYEMTVPPKMFQRLYQTWGRTMKVDAFAAYHNYQLPRYWSYQMDPFAEKIDVFQQNWKRKDLYMFPRGN
jgi:hypothetical protein